MTLGQVSKKRKFVADGVFNAELNEFLARTLGEDGYAGVEAMTDGGSLPRASSVRCQPGCQVRVTPIRTEIIIRATRNLWDFYAGLQRDVTCGSKTKDLKCRTLC